MAKAILTGMSQRALVHRCSAASRRSTGMSANRRTEESTTHSQPHSANVPSLVVRSQRATLTSTPASHTHRVKASSAT